jgi:hypothetical protein
MQTTDNFIDWTSITVVNLENVTWSNRSIPVGVDSEIDIATLTFSIPIYISPPTKVKKMGVITNIITSMFDESRGDIDSGISSPQLNQYDDYAQPGTVETGGGRKASTDIAGETANVNFNTFGAYVDGDTVRLISNGAVGMKNWREIFIALPGTYAADVARVFFRSIDNDSTATGTFTLNPFDETIINVNWDADSFPTDTIISDRTSIDYIINPLSFNPTSIKTSGLRLLLLDDIGDPSSTATEFPVAWQNNDGSGIVASANDIVEWDGTKWIIVFNASSATDTVYTTNLNTNTQYKFKDGEWLKSVDGDYPVGTWRIDLAG